MIIIPRRHYTQPQGRRVIDPSRVAQLGVSGGYFFDTNSPESGLLGELLEPGIGAFNEFVGFRPEAAAFGVVGRYWKDVELTRVINTSTGTPNSRNFSMLFRIRLNAAPTTPGVVARCGTGLAADGTTIPLWRNGGAFDMRVAGSDYAQGGTWNIDEWYDITIVCTATSARQWANSRLVVSGGAPANATLPPRLGFGSVAGGGGASGWFDMEYALTLNRALDEHEALEFHANPWQLFRADPIRIYSLPSGAISLSINSITASNITQTGARITLGLTR